MMRLLRFVAGSVLATLTSAVVFPLVYRGAHAGPRIATFAAFAAGAAVSFAVNRFWTWSRRRRAGLGRDLFGFVAVAGPGAIPAAVVTSITGFFSNPAGGGGHHPPGLVGARHPG